MKDRRPLSEGVSPPPIDPEIAKRFIHGEDVQASEPEKPATTPVPATTARVPISTRIRGDFAAALKRCSLERQLHGQEPNTLQDILEQAIEPWLKSHGYIQ